MPKILLPARINPWPPFMQGLNTIASNQFQGRLYTLDNVKSSGVPSLFAHPFVFSKRLEANDSQALNQFSVLIRGVFLGVIEIKKVPLAHLGRLGDVACGFEPGITSIPTLKWKKRVNGEWEEHLVGGMYPECLVFPAVRVTQTELADIDRENTERERFFGTNAVRGHFRQWVTAATAGIGGVLPLWANNLFWMTNPGGVWEAPVGVIGVLPPLGDRSLELGTAEVSGGGGSIIGIPLVRYIDHLLVCANGGATLPINLSQHNATLQLGTGRRISCALDGSLICGAACAQHGVGPTIDEAGFYERSPGQYVIWKDFGETTLPRGCTGVEWSNDATNPNHADFIFGNVKVRINGAVVSKEKIFCENVIRLDNTNDPGAKAVPDLPVRSEYLDCVDGVNRIGGTTYDVRLKGIANNIVYAPRWVDVDKASILLWPSFKDPAWQVNYAFFHPSNALQTQGASVKLMNKSDKNVLVIADKLRGDEGIRTDVPVTHIEFFLKMDGQDRSVGIFEDGRKIAPPVAGGAIELALDFGTSNTMLAIRRDIGGGQVKYEEMVIEDKSVDCLRYYMERGVLQDEAYWLPTYVRVGEQPLSSIPSELIFRTARERMPNKLDAPMAAYTIPHPLCMKENTYEHDVHNFKWRPPGTFKNHETETVKAYLNMIMHMALAVLRDVPYDNVILTATYPLAFGSNKYISYRDLLTKLAGQLYDETGMHVTMKRVTQNGTAELISESHAGKARFVTTGAQYVVDIGGGTTDITLSKGADVLAVDSINYAGGTCIDFLAADFPDGLVPANKQIGNLSLDDKKVILNRQIRAKGSAWVIQQYNDPNTRDAMIEKLAHFYERLFEYLHRLLDAHGATKDITLYPIGNGWDFTDAIPAAGRVDGYISGWFQHRGIGLEVVSPMRYAGDGGASTRKGAVATGALILAERSNFIHPDLDCPVKSIVGCDVELYWDNDNKSMPLLGNQIVPLNLNIPDASNKPIISTKDFIDSLSLTPKNGASLFGIGQAFNGKAGDALRKLDGSWHLTKSLYAVFLEDIFPLYYL